jgi:hypothetical protein
MSAPILTRVTGALAASDVDHDVGIGVLRE